MTSATVNVGEKIRLKPSGYAGAPRYADFCRHNGGGGPMLDVTQAVIAHPAT